MSKNDLISLVQSYSSEIDKLRHFIKQMQNARFGRRSEKLDADQSQLGLEDLEQSAATTAAPTEQAEKPSGNGPRQPPRRNRGALPSHLPREEIVVPPAETACPCCGGALHVIGEDVAEMLDIVPAQFKVKVIRRPRLGCRACEGGVFQAPAPSRPIDGGMATEALVAYVLTAKYADHTPLYRQAQIYARQGIELDRSTLAGWVGRACWWLRPIHDRVLTTILASAKIFADDTTVPVLDPGRGRTKTGRLWVYARDDRPWAGSAPPAVAYVYSEDRQGRHPTRHLADFRGVLQVDGFAGFDSLAAAIRYALTRWTSLSVFLADGRVEMDTNTVERSIRPIALGRKNHLFAGSDGGAENWAVIATLIQTARLNGIEPFAYLRDTLTKLVAGHPINRIDELLPWDRREGGADNYAMPGAATPAP